MRIRPDETNFRRWIRCIPKTGDLFFFKKRIQLPLPMLTIEQVKSQSEKFLPLNSRSWYRHSIHRAKFCVWMPKGAFETLDSSTRAKVQREQKKFGIKVVSAKAFAKLGRDEKLRTISRWFNGLDLNTYDQVASQKLTPIERQSLRRTGIQKRLNRYAGRSGPNCFATVATCITRDVKLAAEWMHWPTLARHLKYEKFRFTKNALPRSGDVVIFLEGAHVAHAAYALSENKYFEKPGQDFYEPYRIANWADRKREWPGTKIKIYRRVADSQSSRALSSPRA